MSKMAAIIVIIITIVIVIILSLNYICITWIFGILKFTLLAVVTAKRKIEDVSRRRRRQMIIANLKKGNRVNTTATAWASCQIRKIAGAHAPGMPGTFSPSPQVRDPDMHHGTCVTHVPWCMSGSLTCGFLWNRRRGKTFPAFPAHAQPAILRIW